MAWTEEWPFQALALTGGGYRGLFTARALQEMEDHIGEPIGRRFDLSYGTSIGGILALAFGLVYGRFSRLAARPLAAVIGLPGVLAQVNGEVVGTADEVVVPLD